MNELLIGLLIIVPVLLISITTVYLEKAEDGGNATARKVLNALNFIHITVWVMLLILAFLMTCCVVGMATTVLVKGVL